MKQKRVLVIGLGGLGSALVDELWEAGVELVIVDKSEAAVDALKDKASAAFVADGSDVRTLEGVNAKEMDVAVIAGGDFESSVLTVSTLAQMNVPVIIARAGTERQAAILRAVGATRVVQVEYEMGKRLAPEVLSPASSALAEYASSFRVVAWTASGAVIGKTVAEFNRRHAEINVLGYWRDEGKRRPVLPSPDYRIENGDALLLIGHHDAVEKFLARGGD